MGPVERRRQSGGPPEVQVQELPSSGTVGPPGAPVAALGPPLVPGAYPSERGVPRPLPATGIGFCCPSPRCRRDKRGAYAKASGFIQHLNQQHKLEEAQSLRIPDRLPDIVKCRLCGTFCQNAKGLAAHQKHKHKQQSVVPSPAGQLNPAEAPPPPDPDPAPPDLSSAGPVLSDEQLLDIFQRPLYDIYRAWRAPLFRIVRRLSQGILEGTPVAEERCTLAFLLLPGLIAECHYGKWIPIPALLSHLESGVDRACSDEDYGAMVLAQAQVVVPRVQAYRDRTAAARQATPPVLLDHAAVAALQRNIDRLLRQRRLGAANRLLDKLQATLLSGAVSSELALQLEEVRAEVAKLFPPAGDRDTFSEAQLQEAQATAPLSLPPGFIGTVLPTLNRGSGSGVSGWTNAFILDVFTGVTDTRGTGVDLLTDLCNKMLAGQMRSPLWLLSRLVLIPKPSDPSVTSNAIPSALVPPVTLRPLGLPEIFYRLAGRAAVKLEGPLVGPTMEPVQLGVGIPSGCQIGARGAQCAFDAKQAVSAFDVINAFNTEDRQSTFAGVSSRAPRMLRYYVWAYGRETPLLWHGHPVGMSATGVKQGDPAGPLYFAVSTYPLFCSIRDAVERTVREQFPLMPSHVGVTAICDDLTVVSDPQLALLVSEVVQRKFAESGRRLNIPKCRILVHPDSAHLVVWPKAWCPGLCATLPVVTTGMKLLGAPIGTEVFRRDYVEQKVLKAAASVPALEHLAPSATWSMLRYCVNERINYLAQVTEFPLVQESLARMDAVIDQAILRAAGLPLASPDSLTYLTTCTLRSLPTALGGLGIRRYSGLAGELACLRTRTVFYEFAEQFSPQLLEGASEDFWQPIFLGAAENRVWTEVAGLFGEEPSPEDDPAHQPPPSSNVTGMFRAYYLASGESSPLPCCTDLRYSAAERRSFRIGIRGAEANIKTEGKKIQGVWFDALVQLLHCRGRLSEACLLKSNKFPRYGCWLAGPGGYLSGTTNLTRAEYRMALRLRLLRSPASLDVGDAEGCVWCRCNQRISLDKDPMHFFHCPSSQGQFIRRHNHIRDAISDQLAESVRHDTCPYDVSVELEPLVRHCLPAPPLPPSDGAMETDPVVGALIQFEDDDEEEYIEEARRPLQPRMTLKDLRKRNAADKAAGQCRGDVGLSVDGLTAIVDVAVGDATAPSYRQPPPAPPPPSRSLCNPGCSSYL